MHAKQKENFIIASWNLEHATSFKEFKDWVEFCEPLDWVDPEDRDVYNPNKTHLPYCNALNGKEYKVDGSGDVVSLPIHTENEWMLKASQIKDTINLIAPDIIALQEVSSEQAMVDNVGEGYQFFFKKASGVKQQLGFALKEDAIDRYITNIQLELFSELSIASSSGHKVRPGLILKLEIHGRPFTFLNVHLKAGCSTDPISRPKITEKNKADKAEACLMLAKQIQILEKWVEDHSQQSVILLGDLNRASSHDYKIFPVRLDGENPQLPQGSETRYGSFFNEISDGDPYYADLIHLPVSYVSGVSSCRPGIDHILFNKTLVERERLNTEYLRAVSLPFATGESPTLDGVKTSDHCLLTTTLKVKREAKVKHVVGIPTDHSLSVSSYQSLPVSTLLYGYDKSDPKEKITEEDCALSSIATSLACQFYGEQKQQFILHDNIEDVQALLANHFVPKVQYVVNSIALGDYYYYLSTKKDLSIESLDTEAYQLVNESTQNAPSQSKFIRPHIIQAASKIGVNVDITKSATIYNTGFIFGKKGPGRSYGITSYTDGLANDASYSDLFERMFHYLKYANKETVRKFYDAFLSLLMFSSTENFQQIDAFGQGIITDLYAVYLAEGFRYHTSKTVSPFHDDLLAVTLIAYWAVKTKQIIGSNGLSEMDLKENNESDRLKGFIGWSKDKKRSGLGYFRDNRIMVQRKMCASANIFNKKWRSATVESDCIYGFVRYVRNPHLVNGLDADLFKKQLISWIVDDLPSMKGHLR